MGRGLIVWVLLNLFNVLVGARKMVEKMEILVLTILYGFIIVAGIQLLVFMFKKQ